MQSLQSPSSGGHKIISPTASAGGASATGSVGVNSNGTMFSGSPDAKESIASRSEANYPIIDSRSGIWDARKNQKLLRFVTVIAYIFFVSLAAIVLSLYYYFFHVPHMGTSGYSDGRTMEEMNSLKGQDCVQESYVSRGRKRVSLQHNVEHFPLEAASQVVVPSLGTTTAPHEFDHMSVSSTSDDFETTTETIAVRFTRHESPPETVAQALPLSAYAYSLPTSPSVYEIISRRFKGLRPSPADRRTEVATTTSKKQSSLTFNP